MKTRLLFRAALMIALLTVGARIQIPLPYFDYYTLQFTFVLLAAVILPPRYAWGSVATYVLMGLIGIPILPRRWSRLRCTPKLRLPHWLHHYSRCVG